MKFRRDLYYFESCSPYYYAPWGASIKCRFSIDLLQKFFDFTGDTIWITFHKKPTRHSLYLEPLKDGYVKVGGKVHYLGPPEEELIQKRGAHIEVEYV